MKHSDKYLSYMRSDAWALKREACFARAGYQCEKCTSRQQLEAHHRTYARLGDERPDDLQALCKPCHNIADKAREWNSRLDGWATKVYGEDWELEYDPDRVERHFDAWLAHREGQ